ncbi:uncharacterized protein (DUF1810 family) [Sphingomonas vulcanisoli]|uniref:Uncharacterized protein (DUF1810 family) n=1 Tax=Sphingomonas vulcanisoli TaxID=1658060 RepID=A0ABX0TV96_9SPHN|nr:DUF1810 domain-containing protein [Sphingomonas vulcanisoli]NIJ07526.1 uncharacterized protein (DUF1810 family) [Sphingomonas vulcanisoli]
MSLDRFVAAQAGSYATALAELEAGAKRSHWMWYIFPQIAGLGRSDMARFYAIDGLTEARDYLAHPILGPRLQDCVAAMLDWAGKRDAATILGGIDAIKLCSCCTLFETADGGADFARCIDAFYAGARDPDTLRLLA